MHVGDFGFELILDTTLELEDVTHAEILYRKPSGETGAWSAYAEGTHVVHVVGDGELDEAGVWVFQAHVVGIGYELFGDKVSVLVKERIETE